VWLPSAVEGAPPFLGGARHALRANRSMGGDGPAAPAVGASAGVVRNVDVFENLDKVGSGTYGDVFRATSKDTNAVVALKKIRMTKDQETDGFPITALREIKILKQLKHKNVVDLMEIVTNAPSEANRGKGSIYMVFEFMDYDLTGLMESSKQMFAPAQVKGFMKQLLEGIHYVHANNVLHRDIKAANLLINRKGELKLGDFGLARRFERDKAGELTNRCITLWYRPPELLLGATRYTTAVDMWSIGCVFFELITKRALLPGRDEVNQLERICELCGTPSESVWPGVSKLPYYDKMLVAPNRPLCVRNIARRLGREVTDREALDLLDKLLCLDPRAHDPCNEADKGGRISAHNALDHTYFWNDPKPQEPTPIPDYRHKRRQQQGQQQPPPPQQHMRAPPPQPSGGPSRPAAAAALGFTMGVPKRPFGLGPVQPAAASEANDTQASQKLPRYQ